MQQHHCVHFASALPACNTVMYWNKKPEPTALVNSFKVEGDMTISRTNKPPDAASTPHSHDAAAPPRPPSLDLARMQDNNTLPKDLDPRCTAEDRVLLLRRQFYCQLTCRIAVGSMPTWQPLRLSRVMFVELGNNTSRLSSVVVLDLGGGPRWMRVGRHIHRGVGSVHAICVVEHPGGLYTGRPPGIACTCLRVNCSRAEQNTIPSAKALNSWCVILQHPLNCMP